MQINELSQTIEPQVVGDTILVAMVSDLHFGGEPQNTIIKQILRNIAPYRPHCVIGTGDLTEADTNAVKGFNALIRHFVDSTQIPFYCLPGNHEIDEDAPQTFPVYRKYMASLQDTFLDLGKYRFLLINNILDTPTPPKYRISNAALQKIENLMNDPEHRVLCAFMHAPLSRDYTQGACNECGACLYNPLCSFNGRVGAQPGYVELHRLQVKYKVKASFSGHVHQFSHDHYAACQGVHYIVAGGGCLGDSAIREPEQLPADFLYNKHFWLLLKIAQQTAELTIELHSLELPNTETSRYTLIL